MKLWKKILLAIALGSTTGFLIGPKVEFIKPVGTIFLNLLNMIIIPLVFSSMALSVSGFPSAEKLGRIGVKTVVLYVVTTFIAIVVGVTIASFLNLGQDLNLVAENTDTVPVTLSLSTLITQFVPKNPIQAFAEGNILQVIFCALLFGFTMNLIGEKASPVKQFLQSLSHVMHKMTHMVMALSPYGVFALMAWATGSFGLDLLLPVLKFLFSFYVVSILFIIALAWALIKTVGLPLLPFFRGMTEVCATAISTCSSSATLPLTIECGTEKIGLSQSIANFVLPLGTTLNMNGSALFQSMGVIFIAQAYNIEITLAQYATLFSCILIANLGTASIPGGGIVMLSVVFSAVGIPLEGIGILASVDRLRDMMSSVVNIVADVICAVHVAAKEGELDTAIYHQTAAKELSY